MNVDLQNLKEIIAKANPTLEDVERVAGKTLDDLCVAFLNSRLARQNIVVQSVMKGAQSFAGLPEGSWSHSFLVRHATIKNLNNSADAVVRAWPQLSKVAVLNSIKQGTIKWIEKTILENQQQS